MIRFSSIIDVKQLKSKWKVKEERRQKLKQIKEKERLAREEKERLLQEQRERIKRNRELREQNALKNVKYQIVCLPGSNQALFILDNDILFENDANILSFIF